MLPIVAKLGGTALVAFGMGVLGAACATIAADAGKASQVFYTAGEAACLVQKAASGAASAAVSCGIQEPDRIAAASIVVEVVPCAWPKGPGPVDAGSCYNAAGAWTCDGGWPVQSPAGD